MNASFSSSIFSVLFLCVGTLATVAQEGRKTFCYCSRAGCTVTVNSSADIDGKAASAQDKVIEQDAIDWCEGYVVPNWKEQRGGTKVFNACVQKTLREEGRKIRQISADCSTGLLVNESGDRWRVTNAARRGSTDSWSLWEPVGRKVGENERPPFEANGSQYAFLCPTTAQRWRLNE